MDTEQEALHVLGFFGIIKESTKLIFTQKKIFTQITLSLILPLTFMYLAQNQISDLIFKNIATSLQLVYFLLFQFVYIIFLLIFSLLSTSAVVYTIACVYTAKEISYRKVMKVVPKVWKKLLVTFIWTFIVLFVYSVVAVVFILLALLLYSIFPIPGLVIIGVVLLIYFLGFVYIVLIWQLASVVSVLEDLYGRIAMRKSKELIKGKMGVSFFIFLILLIFIGGIDAVFQIFADAEIVPIGLGGRIVIGILCLGVLLIVFLFNLVIPTVIYFVCKSYHRQNIDRSSLADQLEAYLGNYGPPRRNNVPLQENVV